MKTKLIFLLILVLPIFVKAIKPPIKFGKIAMSDLEMTQYEKDTSAPAVILCDYGYFNSNEFRFVRTLRIKILKKEGYSWANMVFPTVSKSNIRGITYNLENGEIVKEKLKMQSIYTVRVFEDYYNNRVAMPNVKVGSVIDIEFTYYGLPAVWKFQETIPIIWNELVLEPSIYVDYRKNFFGYEPLFITEDDRWVAKDVPAFKEEPFINSMNNYLTKFEIDISAIRYPRFYRMFANSWEDISNYLINTANYEYSKITTPFLNSIANEIKENAKTDEEKLEMAFNIVKTIKWNEIQSIYTSNDLSKVYKDKVGNSAEINLTLYHLLKKLKFDANIVVLSTRENGILSPANPSIRKLNHVITMVKLNSDTVLLDATEDYLPYNLIPIKCLNWQGKLIDRDHSTSIALKTDKKEKELIYYNLTLNDDLVFNGTINYVRSDYSAYHFRKYYHSFNGEEEYFNDYSKDKSGLQINQSSFENIDSIKLPVKDNYSISIHDRVTQIDDEYYFYPLFFDQIKDNPFKTDKRIYPVDFAYKIQKNIVASVTIPDGFEIVELPQSIKMNMEGNSGSFIYQISGTGNMINLNFNYSINKEIFMSDQYQELKEFYNQMLIKHSQPIILRKKA